MSTTASAPPRKRTRKTYDAATDGDEQRPTGLSVFVQLVRDEEFWYEDGTIDLVAGNVIFRVYKGVLAEHSAVFKDMFSLPQPPSESSSSQCPVVYLSDSPEDLRHVLRVLMPRNDVSPFSPYDPSFNMISATIRLGNKYEMPRLVEHSVHYLKKWFPGNLSTWVNNKNPLPPGFRELDAIGVIHLARFLDEESILPSAFLTCCFTECDILRGREREDGTLEQLTLNDVGICLGTRTRLIQEIFRFVLEVYKGPPSTRCSSPELCRNGLSNALEVLGKYFVGAPPWRTNPFNDVAPIIRDMTQKSELCNRCRSMVRARETDRLRVLWARMPELMGP
ncbi:hypothetical protein C8Q73DRAFT_657461 [Cubamyces lactineus]|nr:hypothetical protein C8Q73DRAFT_657461 [Cubamyces lactineus]